MPNAKVLSEKQAIVASLTEKLQGAAAGVIVDYKGITVAEDTELRAECRKNDVEYAVVEEHPARFAFNNVGLNELDDQLNGTTSLAIAADPVAPARVIADFAKKLNGKFEIKGGFMDGQGRRSWPTDQCSGRDPRTACPAGTGAWHHAGSHFGLGLRPQADRREERCSRRGSFRRVIVCTQLKN
ncbi:MAG: 50S ribosomal protein L10 [Oscillibacter sp.]